MAALKRSISTHEILWISKQKKRVACIPMAESTMVLRASFSDGILLKTTLFE